MIATFLILFTHELHFILLKFIGFMSGVPIPIISELDFNCPNLYKTGDMIEYKSVLEFTIYVLMKFFFCAKPNISCMT